MHKQVILDREIVCTVKKSARTRRVRLAVRADGSVVLTLPVFVSYAYGTKFLESNSEWIRQKVRISTTRPKHLLLCGSVQEYQKLKILTLQLVEVRLRHFQKIYGVTWKRISIRNQKTRFGSCSRQGNLSFNYRLFLLSPHLCDYIIVHELCHLIEFNHSPRFWSHIAKTFPDFRTLRRELRLL